jgi:hypothetical protein
MRPWMHDSIRPSPGRLGTPLHDGPGGFRKAVSVATTLSDGNGPLDTWPPFD